MRKYFSLLIAAIFTFSFSVIYSQKVIKNTGITSYCYAGTNVNRIYIPPVKRFFSKSNTTGKAKVTFYYTGFSQEAVNAIENAAIFLENFLPPGTDVTINAAWQRVNTSGVLAYSAANGYIGGWAIDGQVPYSYYPIALAEKVYGSKLNTDADGDVDLTVNSAVTNWYFGSDGATPSNKYDLITVVMHEVLHGLGFFDSFTVSNSLGSYGLSGIPVVYDTFIENQNKFRLTDTLKFEQNSTGLKNEITGEQLYFSGPCLTSSSSGRVKVWAPVTFDAGSTISHLDENAVSNENSLMTPYISLGEAIHNPGQMTFSILADLGWINTKISHTPPGDTEEYLANLTLTASVKSDTTYNHNKVGLVYSIDDFTTIDTLFMTSAGSNDNYTITLPINFYNKELQYYIFTEDYFKRIYKTPSLTEIFRYSLYIGTDTVKPVVSHTKADYYLETIDTIKLEATATDNIAMDSVYIEYRINNTASKFIGASQIKKGDYRAAINVQKGSINGGDTIFYRIFAADSSISGNVAISPKSSYYKVGIEDISTVVDKYQTDFASAVPDFFNKDFSISKPSLFSNFGLHTKHPYESPEDNGDSIVSVSLLRHPIKMSETGMIISYREIVLVEPGLSGAPFGTSDFFDYVVVEGSKNFGKTWFALTDGYDSRYNSAWELIYNNSVVGNNSTATGDESMLKNHTIFYKPGQHISAGDTMLLRFRLFSDPFANGWGWVIEDLKITPLVDAINETIKPDVVFYPNPGNGQIHISEANTLMPVSKTVRYKVFNMAGNCIADSKTTDLIDISSSPEGMYIIVLYRDDGIITIKYSLIR